ncbi:MAG: DNRLRE domain-containing protein [Victivallales bacterium]|nr:DNRLRE domain-containing protein [Victivallales bacterium]
MIKKPLYIIHFALYIALALVSSANALTISGLTTANITPSVSDSADGPAKMLMKFELSDSIDSVCYVENAEIVIGIEPDSTDREWDKPPELKICKLNHEWTPSGAAWSGIKHCIDESEIIRPDYYVDERGYLHWNITEFVRSWAKSGGNHGIIIMPRKRRDVFSIDPLRPPRVEIEYLPMR